MPSAPSMLVMGALGSVGRLVLEQLLADGAPVRASSRRAEPDRFPAGVDVRTADLTDPESLAPAFDGVAQVFLYATHEGLEGVVEALRAARVERVVLMSSGSVVHPTSAGNPIAEEHREVERAYAAAGVDLVPVRPLVLATNALGWTHQIKAAGTVSLYRPDALLAPVHERDIAAVAVEALRGRDDVGAVLTGPARLSQRDQIAAIGAAAGRSIEVEELSRDATTAQLSRFMPAGEVEGVLQYLDDAAAGNSPATGTAEDVLGRAPLSFDTWAADHAEDFR